MDTVELAEWQEFFETRDEERKRHEAEMKAKYPKR